MTAERQQATSPDAAGGAENPATESQQTTDVPPDPAGGTDDRARAALAAVYGTFTEGFTTPDLLEAAALQEALA